MSTTYPRTTRTAAAAAALLRRLPVSLVVRENGKCLPKGARTAAAEVRALGYTGADLEALGRIEVIGDPRAGSYRDQLLHVLDGAVHDLVDGNLIAGE